ncbi:PLP-dependent transferase [Nadsonia fulvescens var. elongata DSM 6958]|uniref:PLP-dependent transferase n=1 Tax=Nadsonia fulvescens var. elongata DSM 6958 TaxID=857566 RepID=A0A1E3PDZ4_9ASCO|nr:PLP-dependent transferase [Nadsonia fulvescens var. elongata DSM 6958]
MEQGKVNDAIPANEVHSVSFWCPTIDICILMKEASPKLPPAQRGYPRAFTHKYTTILYEKISQKFPNSKLNSIVGLMSERNVKECISYIHKYTKSAFVPELTYVSLKISSARDEVELGHSVEVFFLFLPSEELATANLYVRYSGEFLTSRLSEFILNNWTHIEAQNGIAACADLLSFVTANREIKTRIAQMISYPYKNIVSSDDVYLFPSGMASIYHTLRAVQDTALSTRKLDAHTSKAVIFGFPFVDTREVMNRFGPGFEFFPFGTDKDLTSLIVYLESHHQSTLLLHCEVPANPLLTTPNLAILRQLANKYNIPLCLDDTIGTFLNIDALSYGDIVMSSLTKLFNGSCDAMAGSIVLNPGSRFYKVFKHFFNTPNQFAPLWLGDALVLDKNSRDFAQRNQIVNSNAQFVADLLKSNIHVKRLHYPSADEESKYFYDKIKKPNGGYGCLLSIIFKETIDAGKFYEALQVAKGPSLGTNFTLAIPFAIIGHNQELEYVSQFGVEKELIRISVGMESQDDLRELFTSALNAAVIKNNIT